MATTEFNYTITTPDQLVDSQWEGIRQAERDAFSVDLMNNGQAGPQQITRADVDHFLDWYDEDQYIATRLDPNLLVGNRMLPNQEYSQPHVVLADDGDRIVGVLYTALNVSGSSLARQIKRHMPGHQFVWHRSIAVTPTVRGQGVATAMERVELENRDSRLQATAYVWPVAMKRMYERLVARGFVEDGERRPVTPFGADRPEVQQARMVASLASLKRRYLKPEDEGQRLVIRHALQNVDNQLPDAT